MVLRATARPVGQALARHGIPGQILTDNGKVFTARFGTGPGPVMSGRICTDNGIRHILTAPYSTTKAKIERLHKAMRAEFSTRVDRVFTAVTGLPDALDAWTAEYNTARPHQSCGGPPTHRAVPARRPVPRRGQGRGGGAAASTSSGYRRQAPGVSRWVNTAGKVSLGGFSYTVGATYAGAGRSGRDGRPGRHLARQHDGRHPRPAAARRPGRPRAAGPGGPQDPGTPPPGRPSGGWLTTTARSPSPG